MTPILGIYASARPPVAAGDYESIATVTVSSATAATIEFTSIPATYTHLQLRGIGRTDRAAVRDYYKVQFNSDTGSNYAWHQLYGTGTSAGVQAGTTATEIRSFRVAGANDDANVFGAQVVDILDYADTNKYKTLRSLGGIDTDGEGEISLNSGLWQNTNAITSIQLKPGGGTNWVQYSTFALYGIKGA